MSRQCQITNKGVLSGHHVSHAKNRVKRVFLPNIRLVSFVSDLLGEKVILRVSHKGLRTVEHKGGIDRYVLETPLSKIPSSVRAFKKRLEKVCPRDSSKKVRKKEVSARILKKRLKGEGA